MIRVLIVEDEPPIARAVSKMVESLSDAFEVVGCESNGQAALLRMEEEPADVIITDIRMPVMNGLELLERVIALYPNCLSVILSGHQDFSYAQAALRLGAFDYILKPLAPDKIRDLLARLEDAYVKNRLQQNRGGGAWDINVPRGTGISNKADNWVLLANAGNWPLSPDDALVPGASFWKEHRAEKLIRVFLNEGEDALVLEGKVSTEYVFILKNTAPERVSQISQALFSALTRLSPLPKTLYVASKPVAFWETGLVIRYMRSRLYSEIKLCCSMLLTDTGPVEKHSCAGLVEFPVNKVVEALCVRDTGQIGDAIGEAVDIARSNEMTEMEFAGYLGAVINDKRLMPQFAAGLKLDLYDEISNAVSFEGLKAGLIQTINFAGMDESKVDRKTMVSQIEQYLRDNYTSSISNEMLAALFGFVPSYISKIFRAYSGLSPAEYLIKLRVEKAKELLETRRELLIKEVSQLVGYDDQYYFSKVFKKATGLWPTQYQIGQIENQAKN